MRPTKSRTITSLFAVGAGFAVSAIIGAPAGVRQHGDIAYAPGQVVIDDQCNVPDNADNVPAPQDGTGGPGMGGGDSGMGGSDHGGGHGR